MIYLHLQIINQFSHISIISACSPPPRDLWLSIILGIGENINSFINELIVRVSIVIQEVKVACIIEIAVAWVTEVNNSALFGLSVCIDDAYAFVAEFVGVHTASSVDGDEAVWEALGLAVPVGAGVLVVTKISTETAGCAAGSWVAGDGWVSEMGFGRVTNLFDDLQRGHKANEQTEQNLVHSQDYNGGGYYIVSKKLGNVTESRLFSRNSPQNIEKNNLRYFVADNRNSSVILSLVVICFLFHQKLSQLYFLICFTLILPINITLINSLPLMLDYHGTYRSPINTSRSKQLYTFPKQSRFKRHPTKLTANFYNLPSLLQKRAATFGVGRKHLQFPHHKAHELTPPPNSYRLTTDIQQNSKSRKGLTISSRLASQGMLRRLSQTPGPGSYNPVDQQMRSHGLKFNRDKKVFEYPVDIRNGRESPGPAVYDGGWGRRRDSSPKFGSERRMSNSSQSISPGPSAYEGQKIINSYIGSKFGKVRPIGFEGYSSRGKLKSMEPRPSPASYLVFSQFAVRQKPFKLKSNRGLIDRQIRNRSSCTHRTTRPKPTRLATQPTHTSTQTTTTTTTGAILP